MSDLSRQRDARELWVSRSHLHAAVIGSALFGLLCFGTGVVVGKRAVGAAEPLARAPLVEGVPGDQLVKLLAEVERGALANASKQVIYQDVLERRGRTPIPEEPAAPVGLDAAVGAPPGAVVIVGDAVPEGEWTILAGEFNEESEARSLRAHLGEAHPDVWLSLVRVDGEARYRVGIGGFADEESAKRRLADAADALEAAPLLLGDPAVTSFATLVGTQ